MTKGIAIAFAVAAVVVILTAMYNGWPR